MAKRTKFISDKIIEGGTPFGDWLSDVAHSYSRRDLYTIAEYLFNEASKLGRSGRRSRLTPQQLLAIHKAKNWEQYLDLTVGEGVTRKTFDAHRKSTTPNAPLRRMHREQRK